MTIFDANLAVSPNATLRADVCIVGAGAAGITLARGLAQAGVSVLLLEGGGVLSSADSQELYEAEDAGRYRVSVASCRQRYLGGSTNCWQGWCRPLDPEDFESRSAGLPGWPIGPAELRPFYARAQRTLAVGALQYDGASLSAASGLPLLPLDPARVGHVAYQFSPYLVQRFVPAYRTELEELERIALYTNANLLSVRLAESAERVGHLSCSTLTGIPFRAEASDYVLALGGIENPRMLLASRQDVTVGLGNQSGLVGEHFMEHPHLYRFGAIALRRQVDTRAYTGAFRAATADEYSTERVDTSTRLALALPRTVRESEGLVNASVSMVSYREEDRGELGSLGPEHVSALLSGSPAVTLYHLNVRTEQRPASGSRVRLRDDSDALGVPRARVEWNVPESDLLEIHRTLELIAREVGRAGIGRMFIPEIPVEQWLVSPGCHHMGATRMASSPEHGVVDADCRVFGVENLFLGGCSVFPTGGFANPTLTLVALAHRLGDHLRGRWEGDR